MRLTLVAAMMVMMGCASGNCRQVAEQGKEKQNTAGAADSTKTAPSLTPGFPTPSTPNAPEKNILPTDTVRVFKYDGSQQCGMGKAISLATMQNELKGIQVISSENKADGLMHMTVCGGNTGNANVYTILKKDLASAAKAGFREWTFD
jgi:hypothetical protein